MNKKPFYYISSLFAGMLFVLLFTVTGCKDEDEDPMTNDPVASFQFAINPDNFLEVTFTNFSQNATAYQWDFGDGNSSTESDPVHVYDAPGTYTVILTANNGSAISAPFSVEIMLEDPNELLTLLAGTTSKTWYLQREGTALGIGPNLGDNGWWSFGGVTPLGDRPCILDDAFTFHRDLTWEFNSNNTLFIDAIANGGWIDDTERCWTEDEAGVWDAFTGEDVSAFASGGSYTFEFDAANSRITLLGSGAYIGLPNKTEAGDSYIPVDIKNYVVGKLSAGDIADTLQVSIEITGGGGFWNFNLVSYHNIMDLPDIPRAEPRAEFQYTTDGATVTFDNLSSNATSYMWDFGDGNMSTDEDPVYTYAADGDYTVSLTAMDGMGGSDMTSQVITISTAAFDVSVLSSETGKAWVLDGEGSFKVGPTRGSGEWWGGLDAGGVEMRSCMMDDEFIFFDDGTYEYDSKGDTYGEPYMGVDNACVNDEDLVAPYDVLASGIHAFTADNAVDPDPAMVTVMGDGAFIGFNKAFNGGELDGVLAPKSEIYYEVFNYVNNAGVETVTFVIDIAGDETAWWTIRLKAL